jgi:hypothetical protein
MNSNSNSNYATADLSLTISNTIWSAIGKQGAFGRFDRDIMRDIRHDKLIKTKWQRSKCFWQ